MARWRSAILSVVVLVGVGSATPVAAHSGGGGGGDDDELGYQETIDFALEDIQEFWSEHLPDLYGIRYRVLRDDQIIPYDEDTAPSRLPACGEEQVTYEDLADNAFYCVLGAEDEEDVVAYDDGGLFPELFDEFGPFALVQVLAHEWGHAIQGQVLDFDSFVSAPSIIKELQADCFAGAYIRWVDDGDSEVGFELEPGDLETGIAGMLAFADPVGADAADEGAHGSGFDRVNAFAEGFEQGGARCVEYDVDLPIIQQIPFTTADDLANEGNLPLDEAIEFGIEDLDLYWEAVFDAEGVRYRGIDSVEDYNPRRRSTLPECESPRFNPDRPKKYRGQVFHCPDENFIAYDRNVIDDAYSIGDFGVMVLVGKEWATAMQDRLDLEGEQLQADCFTGAWAGSIPLDLTGDNQPDEAARGGDAVRESAILLSPGDLDEAVMAFIAFSEKAGRGDEGAFARIAAFRTGFFSPAPEADCAAMEE